MCKQNFWKKTKILAGLSGMLLLSGSFLLGVSANQEVQNTITINGIKNQALANRFSTVHFNVGGNDFWGGFFWTEAKKLSTPQIITTTANWESLSCTDQVRGFYYNSQRGERLWPLDEESKGDLSSVKQDYENLSINGGFYTNCQKGTINKKNEFIPDDPANRTNPHTAIYGRITHEYKGKQYSLYAGLLNNTTNNELPPAELRCNLQRIDNQYPFGYIYDKAGGIAMVGAYVKSDKLDSVKKFHNAFTDKLKQQKCVNDFYSMKESEDPNNPGTKPVTDDWTLGPLDNDLIFGNGSALETMMNLGIRGIVGLSSQVLDQKEIKGNTKQTSLLVSTTENISNIINIANKRAESLCRNRWGNLNPNGDVICAKNGGSIDPKTYAGKTIIIQQGDLTLNDYMETTNQPITILLMTWDIKLPNTKANQTFLGNGYPKKNGIIKANFLKGNFIINGLIQGDSNSNNEIQRKLIVHGKIASFNTLNTPTKEVKENIGRIGIDPNKKIGLSEIFTWKCNPKEGTDIDKKPCGQLAEGQDPNRNFLVDKSFGLIDMYFPSKLFK